MPTAAEFDDWYSQITGSPGQRALTAAALGLPDSFASSSLLPWDGIADVVARLSLSASSTFADVGCGWGGYGGEIAARTGAALIGIDWSAVAISAARDRCPDATFSVASLTSTGLDPSSLDAVVSVDAMQFAEPYAAGLAECLRILAPGGRLVITGWMAADLGDPELPPRHRYDLGAELASVGFVECSVTDMPSWRAAERGLWAAAAAADPGDDAGLASLHEEALEVLPWIDRTRRVLAFGRKPA